MVDLSHLTTGELNFITWTLPYGHETPDSYCAMNPKTALDFATYLGLKSVDCEVIEASEAEARMEKVRLETGYEGEVLYFVDNRDNVIGLLKKKTAWYVVLRAIREKACNALADLKKEKGAYSHSAKAKKLCNRLGQIQTWLGFSEAYLLRWQALGSRFLAWAEKEADSNKLPNENSLRGSFPGVWNRFLRENDLKDDFEWE